MLDLAGHPLVGRLAVSLKTYYGSKGLYFCLSVSLNPLR
jgi:hypothetical protein